MPTKKIHSGTVRVPISPRVPDLRFRRYRGTEDISAMVRIANRSWKADGVVWSISEEDLTSDLLNPVNMDPELDLVLAEVSGELVGYGSVYWRRKSKVLRLYSQSVSLLPEWRGKGIRRALLRHNEKRIRQIARKHGHSDRKFIETWANEEPNDWKTLIEGEGYEPSWHLFELVRNDLNNIPDFRLPKHLEIRPVEPRHEPMLWEAAKEAMADERSFSEDSWNDENYEKVRSLPEYSPQLAQVAWDGDEIAGGVHVYIREEENKELNRKRGYTETIFVRRPWRRMGVARALIASSLRVLRDLGMEEAALDVDTDNPSGALRLYESLGYRLFKQFVFYRKPLA
jgi:GNAT superfamily N-acetyltransferase